MRLRSLLSRRELESQIEEELALHLEQLTRDYESRGFDPDAARLAALRRFGDPRAVRRKLFRMESSRIQHEERALYFDELRQDIRYGVRQLLKKPTFTAIIIGTLALGIGASTAVFGVLKAVFLEPLPYPASENLALIRMGSTTGMCCGPNSGPDILDFRRNSRTFESIEAISSAGANLTDDGDAELVLGGRVTTGFVEMLGVEPALGRSFTADEQQPGNNRVVILSDELWKRRFNADPGILGNTITLNREPHTVVGIMPEGFDVLSPWTVGRTHQLYWPLPADELEQGRDSHWLLTYGRLAEGSNLDAGTAELVSIAAALEEQYPASNMEKTVYPISLHEILVGRVGFQLLMLLAAAGFVLLIVCGNVASLLLAKATTRQGEIAIRAAVGASRGRVIRQLLTESLLLASLGGVAGIALTMWGVGILRAAMPASIPRIDQIGVDWTLLGFAAGVSILTGIVFGLAPALSASRTNLTQSLKEGKINEPTGPVRKHMRNALVVGQFALALLLANGAALMLKSYSQARGTDFGFDYENVLTLRVSLEGPQYEQAGNRYMFLRDALERVAAMPGVGHVGAISKLPFEGGTNTHVWAEDDPERTENPNEGPLIELSRVVDGYFQAMGIALVAGRYLTLEDTTSANPGAIVNQEMARRLWPDENPLGKRFSFRDNPPRWITVVGVVADVRQFNVYRRPISEMYLPFPVRPRNSMYLVARTEVEPLSLVSAVRREVFSVDRDQPISQVRAMTQVLSGQFARQRFNTMLTGIFAGVAVILVAAGIYGVMSYLVARGTHEIGVRMALGAGERRVLRLIVLRGLTLALIGSVLGLAGVFASTSVTRTMLFGMSPIDVPTIAAGTLFIITVGIVGSLVPAIRAMRVSPVTALRAE
jgi:putative ABC transport system permease protein